MRTGIWTAIGMFALGLLLAGGLASGGNGYIMPPELLDKIQVGVTMSKQVTEIPGPPAGISIEIDGNGIVRNIIRVIQYGA